MTIPKQYFHDRFVLLLISVNAFLAILANILIIFNLGNGRTNGFIIQYHANLGRISGLESGGAATFIGFMFFALFVLVFNTILSIRVYHIRRHFSLAILAMTLLLLILVVVVSNVLLLNNR